MDTLKAPKHLKAETRRWWSSVVQDYELEQHHLRTLTMAGECWDRVGQARLMIAKEGLTVADRFGQLKAHPACKIEEGNKMLWMKLLRELALDVNPPAESRPAMIRPNGHLKRG